MHTHHTSDYYYFADFCSPHCHPPHTPLSSPWKPPSLPSWTSPSSSSSCDPVPPEPPRCCEEGRSSSLACPVSILFLNLLGHQHKPQEQHPVGSLSLSLSFPQHEHNTSKSRNYITPFPHPFLLQTSNNAILDHLLEYF